MKDKKNSKNKNKNANLGNNCKENLNQDNGMDCRNSNANNELDMDCRNTEE